jgi:3-keto-5-aminohexanoate cleavage enzyme
MHLNAILQKNGWLNPSLHFDFVLGAPASIPGTVINLLFLSESISDGSIWSVAGIGRTGIPLAAAVIVMDGHVQVGLDDNLFMPDGVQASNPELVERVVTIGRQIGREIATPAEARSILRLEPNLKDRIII